MVILLSALSGTFLWASFQPVGWWWLAPIGLLDLMAALSGKPLKTRLLIVAVSGSTFLGLLLAWSNTYVGDLPWIILVASQVIFILPIALLPLSMKNPIYYYAVPPIWILCEWGASHFPYGGFGWGRLAFAQANAPYSALARFGGAPLLSFATVLIAVTLYLLLHRKMSLAFPLVLLIVISSIVLSSISTPQWKKNFSVVAVQGGVPTLGLNFNDRAEEVFRLHLEQTEKYLSTTGTHTDLILWPENAVDVDPFENGDVGTEIDSLVNKYGTPLIFGAVTTAGSKFKNESILWNPNTGVATRYVKRHLTPFGEYIPLRSLAESVSDYAKAVVGFVPGNEIVLHHVGQAAIDPIICFELLDDELGRESVRGANLIVTQTNSATFGKGSEGKQQLQISRVRAIEHQRYIVSVSTTGPSALISPSGEVTLLTKQNERTAFLASVALINSRTFSDRHGEVIQFLLIVLPLLLVARKRRKKIKLLVIIPTYNEVLSVGKVINELLTLPTKIDILVVDDGSPDGTAASIKAMDSPDVHLLERSKKEGLGAAYRAGFAWALQQDKWTHIATMDGDGSHRPEDLGKMIALAEEYEVVMGSRWIDGGGIANWPKRRQWLSKLGTSYARWALKLNFSDLTGGLKIYSTNLLARMNLGAVTSEGYCFQIEMILASSACGASFLEVPIIFVEREQGVSKMSKRIVVEALAKVSLWAVKVRLSHNADKVYYVK